MTTWTISVIILTIIRFASVALYFVIPFAAGFINIFFDAIDGNILFHFETPRDLYQNYDKILDLAAYVAMFWVGLKTPIKKYVKFAFFYRLIGQVLFFFMQARMIFFYFPNLLELPLITYWGATKHGKEQWFLKNRIWIYLFWGLNKMWMEYSIHIAEFSWTGFFCRILGIE